MSRKLTSGELELANYGDMILINYGDMILIVITVT
jgi:hypothetical protein